MASNRIEWIDIAKGISIILVVLGHTRLSSAPYIGDWLGSFRMPFFFFISGLLFNPNKQNDFKTFLIKKWKGLGRPFIIFSLVVLIGYYCIDTPVTRTTLSEFPTRGWGGCALWFIPVLFITNTLYFIICRILPDVRYRIIAILILATSGYMTYILKIPNYWNINFSLTAVFFYGMGNILAPMLNNLFNCSNIKVLTLCLISTIVSLGFIFNNRPEFFTNHLGGVGVTHIIGIAGALMMCCIAVFLSRINHPIVNGSKKTFKYFGKNSYVVLAFHQILILSFTFWIPQMPSIACHITMWTILIIAIEIITRKIPYILGRETNTTALSKTLKNTN